MDTHNLYDHILPLTFMAWYGSEAKKKFEDIKWVNCEKV